MFLLYPSDDNIRPNQIPNLTLWLDADNDASFSVDSFTGEVNSWTGRDSNARVFTPVNASSTTRLVRIAKPNWKNRRVVVSQLTANTGMACPAYDMVNDFAANGKDITIIAMVRTDEKLNSNTTGTLLWHYTSGAIGHYFRIANSASNFRWLALDGGSGGGPLGGANAAFCFGENVISLIRSGNTQTAYVNGAQNATVSSTATAIVSTSAQMFIGCGTTAGGGGFHGDIAEVVMYNRALSQAERYSVENYLASKWLGL